MKCWIIIRFIGLKIATVDTCFGILSRHQYDTAEEQETYKHEHRPGDRWLICEGCNSQADIPDNYSTFHLFIQLKIFLLSWIRVRCVRRFAMFAFVAMLAVALQLKTSWLRAQIGDHPSGLLSLFVCFPGCSHHVSLTILYWWGLSSLKNLSTVPIHKPLHSIIFQTLFTYDWKLFSILQWPGKVYTVINNRHLRSDVVYLVVGCDFDKDIEDEIRNEIVNMIRNVKNCNKGEMLLLTQENIL